jgi:hypothetical protein
VLTAIRLAYIIFLFFSSSSKVKVLNFILYFSIVSFSERISSSRVAMSG